VLARTNREWVVATPNVGRTGALLRAALALACAVAMLAPAGLARAAMYKWVDENGVVHYTDKMPPEAVDKASIELNKQGIPVKKTDKALTPEQRRALEQEAERKKQLARQEEEVARRDRALLSSYSSEAEIDLARNRSLQTINNVVQSSVAFSEQLNKRKADADAKKEEFKGKPVIAVLDRELESIDAELARQAEVIAQKKREAEAVNAKYDADKQRWRELIGSKPATAKSASAAPVPAVKK
jgi:HD superfamily phosphohydrolase